ncbi:hypothetical protein C8R43DRAFT_967308 [Mycena crocata]|nr:hypothetical protein C8R43DRAFT_967308 [Mycena crocata]
MAPVLKMPPGAIIREVLDVDSATAIGPVFIASILNWMLMGTLVMQVYTYYQKFRTDRAVIRLLVYVVFLLDGAQTVMLTHHAWFSLVVIWGKPEMLDVLVWSAAMIPFMCGLVSLIVQIFYAWRIWTLTNSRFIRAISILITLVALTQGLTAMVTAIITRQHPNIGIIIKLHPEFSVWWGGSLVADVLITSCMSYVLYNAKSRTTMGQSETLLTTLINRVVQTGAVTVVCAAVGFGLYLGFPTTTYHFVPSYILGKLYTNSLMLTLNLRRSRDGPDSEHAMTSIKSQDRGGTSVRVERSTLRTTDMDGRQFKSGWAPAGYDGDSVHQVQIMGIRDGKHGEVAEAL